MCHVNVNFLSKIKIIPNLNRDKINQKRDKKQDLPSTMDVQDP